MKTTIWFALFVGTGLAAVPIQSRITPEALATAQAKNPMSRLEKPEPGTVKVTRPDTQSILRDSTILHDGVNWTIVPVGAVLHTPEKLKSRVNAQPTGKMLSWIEFLSANYAWLTTCEVDFEQAAGQKEFPQQRAAAWSKLDKIVIAVHQRGPISAHLKTPDSAPTP